MHVPDGYFNVVTSAGAGAVTAGALVPSLRIAARELTDRLTPLAGLVAAFVFALQMVNFPVAAGTSGHLLGGTLAAVLVGPWLAVLCLAVVLLIQALVFADGGLSAYGLNVVLIGIVPAFVGYGVFRGLLAALPRGRSMVVVAAAAGAALSVPAAAAVFTLLFEVGGTVELSGRSLLVAMVGVHTLIGLGEGALTAVVVRAVVAVRPDLVHGVGWLRPDLSPGSELSPPSAPRRSMRWFTVAAVGVTVAVVVLLAPWASDAPDGLERVATDKGFASAEQASAAESSPLAGYAVDGDESRSGTSGAGLVGTAAVLGTGAVVVGVARRRRPGDDDGPSVSGSAE